MYGSNDFSSLVARADDKYNSMIDPRHYNPYYDPGYENVPFGGTPRIPSTTKFTQEIDLAERRAADFLDSVLMGMPEVASIYGPLTLEQANSNQFVSPEERKSFKETLKNMPELQQRILNLREKLKGI